MKARSSIPPWKRPGWVLWFVLAAVCSCWFILHMPVDSRRMRDAPTTATQTADASPARGALGGVLPTQASGQPSDAERIFMFLSGKLLPGIIAGIVLAAILAAIMSTADSQLLVTASSVSNDMFKLFKKDAKEKTLMWISRGTVIAVAVIAYIIALDPNSSVMGLVSYAWAGLGAAFGPAMLLSLFWKRMTMNGAVAGIISGGASVVIWETIPMIPADGAFVSLSAATGIYSLLPAFIIALAAVIVVSLCTKVDRQKVDELFARANAKETEAQAIGE